VECLTRFIGVINIEEGSAISFETLGFGMVPDKQSPKRWNMVSVVRFRSDDLRYAWLNEALGLWAGVFRMDTYRHVYRVYLHRIGGQTE
jgi:hypothetical protein